MCTRPLTEPTLCVFVHLPLLPPDPVLNFQHPMLFSKKWFPMMAAASRLREHLRALILQRMLNGAPVS